MAQNLPRGTPARVLVLLTLLTGLVTVSAWRDALQRQGNTWVRYPTALGDTALLQKGHLPTTLATEGGRVALSTGGIALRRRDDRMFRVQTGMETLLPFALFTTDENLAGNPDPKLYARTAPHAYVRLRATLANPSDRVPPTDPPSGSGLDPLAGLLPGKVAEEARQTLPVAEPVPEVSIPSPPRVVMEDPDMALALPEEPVSPKPGSILTAPGSSGDLPIPSPPDVPPEPNAPKAIPLPPEEQDSPVGKPAGPTL